MKWEATLEPSNISERLDICQGRSQSFTHISIVDFGALKLKQCMMFALQHSVVLPAILIQQLARITGSS
jgi:hypothetical protein